MEEFRTGQSFGPNTANGRMGNLRAICWRLRRGPNHATCSLYADVARWELRLEVDGSIERSGTFLTRPEWVGTVISWKRRMYEEGWSERIDVAQVREVRVS